MSVSKSSLKFNRANIDIECGYRDARKKPSDSHRRARETVGFPIDRNGVPHVRPKPPDDPEEAAEFTEQVFNKARDGDAEMLDRLVSAGLPVNLKNSKGDTLLMLASYYGHVDAVKVLLKHKADPEMRNGNGQSPIAGAAFKGDLAVVKALVEAGAEIEGSSFDGRTALMMAAMFNRVEIVDYLIGQGADPKAKDANGVTALDAARTMGAVDTTAQLEKLLA